MTEHEVDPPTDEAEAREIFQSLNSIRDEMIQLQRQLGEQGETTTQLETRMDHLQQRWERLHEENEPDSEIERYLREHELLFQYAIGLIGGLTGPILSGVANAVTIHTLEREDDSSSQPASEVDSDSSDDSSGEPALDGSYATKKASGGVSPALHDYHRPSEGTTDWHVPLNDNFSQLDAHVPVRDIESELSNYPARAGAKFMAVDTGNVFLGNGNTWTKVGKLIREERMQELEQRISRIEEYLTIE